MTRAPVVSSGSGLPRMEDSLHPLSWMDAIAGINPERRMNSSWGLLSKLTQKLPVFPIVHPSNPGLLHVAHYLCVVHLAVEGKNQLLKTH